MSFRRSYKYVGRRIEKFIPEVKKRNREALIFSGGEPTLLYIPTGFKDDAEYDDVRNTYRNQDVKYELFLNNYFEGCERLYGNDTDTVPSIRMAFPSNPEGESHREDGLQLLNRNNAWTLWYPILPPRGVIVVRQTPFLGDDSTNGKEMYLLENVTHSYFPINSGSGLHLLHQETPVVRLENGTPVKIEDLPTVEDTLSVYKNDLEYDLSGLSVSGTVNVTDDGTVLNAGSSITTNDQFLNNKIKVDLKPLSSGGQIEIGWGVWSDTSKPFVLIDRDTNTISIKANNTTLVRQTNYTLNTNQQYNIRIELANGVFKVWVDTNKVLEASFIAHTSYQTLQPLDQSEILIVNTGLSMLLHNLYVMSLI